MPAPGARAELPAPSLARQRRAAAATAPDGARACSRARPRSLIQTKYDYPNEQLERLCQALLELVLLAEDDVEAQVGRPARSGGACRQARRARTPAALPLACP